MIILCKKECKKGLFFATFHAQKVRFAIPQKKGSIRSIFQSMEENLLPEQTNDNDRIIQVNIEEQMKTAYIDYSMSVIVGRALPDVRDGFKPVHRRVLYGMSELGNNSNKPYKKAARIVGEVMGKFHPHGDSAIYDTLVRMGQDWVMRHTLVDKQGNFGSPDGDPPAAMRLGATVVGRLQTDSVPIIDIPATALTKINQQPAVWIVDPSSKTVSIRNVDVLRFDQARVVVSQGLDTGEVVVTAGVQALHPGQKIRLLGSEP